MPLVDFEVIDSQETPIGLLYLRRRPLTDGSGDVVTEVMIDGGLLMSSEDNESERALATSAIALHAGDESLRVLVGGLGLGYTAYGALLDPRVRELAVMDPYTTVARWLHAGHLPLSSALTTDDRLALIEADVYETLLAPPLASPWDIVLIDVDHAPRHRLANTSAPFYTEEGQRRVQHHLAPGGVLAVWSAERDEAFAEVLDDVYAYSETEHVSWICKDLDEMEHTLFLARRSGQL